MSEHEDENTLRGGEQDQDSFPPVSHADLTEPIGAQIGPYRLLSVLGEGGFAIVYLAEQKKPVRRQVALKVIKPGMDSKQVIARFEAERQALALLNHPSIAKVFDAGTTENGRPYFAMEHVNGAPITEQCDRDKLTIEERLELFLQVCEAVQHAHQKGVIHRDIKPSNVLVSVQAGRAVPKIIDFGVAKALSQPLTERTLFTEQGQLIGTPEYMSPEQANKDQDIDTCTDVYSLGVLLYVLLAGVLPFDSETLRKGGIDHIRRTICEEDPKRPSTRLGTVEAEESTKLAQQRQTNVQSLTSKLHRELDWITAKAMEKDRDRRYETPHAFAEDIRRWLGGQPVVAKPMTTTYVLQKLICRHVYETAIVVLLALVVLGFSLASYCFYRQSLAEAALLKTEATQRKEKLKQAMRANRLLSLCHILDAWRLGYDVPELQLTQLFDRHGFGGKTVKFIFDERPLSKKVDAFRRDLEVDEPFLTSFAIAKHHLRDGNDQAASAELGQARKHARYQGDINLLFLVEAAIAEIAARKRLEVRPGGDAK